MVSQDLTTISESPSGSPALFQPPSQSPVVTGHTPPSPHSAGALWLPGWFQTMKQGKKALHFTQVFSPWDFQSFVTSSSCAHVIFRARSLQEWLYLSHQRPQTHLLTASKSHLRPTAELHRGLHCSLRVAGQHTLHRDPQGHYPHWIWIPLTEETGISS